MDDINPMDLAPSEAPLWSVPDQMTFGFQVDDQASSPAFDALTRHGSFHAVKQPILQLQDREVTGYEFLTRSSIPGSAMPEDFLRFCLEHNVLGIADLHCLGNCASASQSLPAPLRRHINVYPSTLAQTPVQRVLDSIPGRIRRGAYCLELNESFVLDDPAALIGPIQELKRAGILIAIDDVGFGHSNLESLILLEPDVLKIDKKLVLGIARSSQRMRSLERLLGVARSLGAQAIAEGIETEEDLRTLRDLGVAFGQGFLLGRPA